MKTRNHRPSAYRPWLVIAFALVLILSLSACGDDDDDNATGAENGDLAISDVWSRPAVLLGESDDDMESEDEDATAEDGEMDDEHMDMGDGGTNGVVYMTIENDGDEGDVLVSAETDVAETVELHTVNVVEGVMQMRQVEDGIEIPAGETVVLEPGGLHVMLIGLDQSLEVGDTFEIEFDFENAGSMTVTSEVREP